jgi:hypothetical protein
MEYIIYIILIASKELKKFAVLFGCSLTRGLALLGH